MATLTLGDQKIPVNRSADLDERLLTATGYTGAELAPLLVSPAIPLLATVISALSPKEKPVSRVDIGALLADADLSVIVALVAPLLTLPSAPADAKGGANGGE